MADCAELYFTHIKRQKEESWNCQTAYKSTRVSCICVWIHGIIIAEEVLGKFRERSMAIIAELKMLPVGIEDFQEIRKNGFYYVDKTKLIEQILENWSKVTLFTRPRRFGKTLKRLVRKIYG